jgi:hypothetical protein
MIRTLLANTVLVAVLAVPVLAQDASSSMESSSAVDSSMISSESSMNSSASSEMSMDSSMMSSEPLDSMSSAKPPAAPFDITTGYTQVDTDRLATRIIGQPVFDSPAADANNLGKINDLVLNESGGVAAVVIGVGGFLGIGEKQVAVAYSALQWVVAADNTERFVLETTVDQLRAAPDFVTVEDNLGEDGSVSSSSAM